MKEKEFDSLIKTKVDNIDNLIDIEFEEDAVWKKVSTKIQKNTNSGLYLVISIIILIGIIYFVLFVPRNSVVLDPNEISIPIEKIETEVTIDTVVKLEDTIKEPIVSKKNTLKTKPIKKEGITTRNQRIDTNDTVNLINKLNRKLIDTNQLNRPSKVSNQSKFNHIDFAEVIETRAYIHVYRPGKITGALNMFSLKANGRKIGTITNGEYEVFMVESGLTEFEIKRKKIKINLEPRKRYYLRTELIFLGKTKFERVTESFAKEELGSKKK